MASKKWRMATQGILKQFYDAHAKTRVLVEQLFGIFKNQFMCLKGSRGKGPLRFKNPVISCSVIMACGYLRNFLVETRLDQDNDDDEFMEIENLPPVQAEYQDEENEDNDAELRFNSQLMSFRELNFL